MILSVFITHIIELSDGFTNVTASSYVLQLNNQNCTSIQVFVVSSFHLFNRRFFTLQILD